MGEPSIPEPGPDSRSTPEDSTIEAIREDYRVSLSHARDLLNAAQAIFTNQKLPNVAYHLAVLALEEIGAVQIRHIIRSIPPDRAAHLKEHLHKHHMRVFWALWGMTIGKEVPTGKQFDTYLKLSGSIHEQRLNGLYVEMSQDLGPPSPPKTKISEEACSNLLELAEARLGLANNMELVPLSEQEAANRAWFLEASQDEEKRDFIRSNVSVKRLAESGQPVRWIAWLREQFESAERTANERLAAELSRKPSPLTDESTQKWRMKRELFSSLHTIRPEPLRSWNDKVTWIKLTPAGRRNEGLAVEITLPKSVPLRGCWAVFQQASVNFLTALNIATTGYFWWHRVGWFDHEHVPITDLDLNAKVQAQSTQKDFVARSKAVLSELMLGRTSVCFVALAHMDDATSLPYKHYYTGIGYLAKCDADFPAEIRAIGGFTEALRQNMVLTGEWDGKTDFAESFGQWMEARQFHQEWREAFVDLTRKAADFRAGQPVITLNECLVVKAVCDAYFCLALDALAKRHIEGQEKQRAES